MWNMHCPRALIQSSAEPEQCQQHHDDYCVDNAGDGDNEDDCDGNSKDAIKQNIWVMNFYISDFYSLIQ